MMAEHTRWVPTQSSSTLQRALGDSEYAFFKNSSTGLGDMFLHLAFRAPPDIMQRERVCIAWSMIRALHPLLMSKVVPSDDESPTLWYVPHGKNTSQYSLSRTWCASVSRLPRTWTTRWTARTGRSITATLQRTVCGFLRRPIRIGSNHHIRPHFQLHEWTALAVK